MTDEIRGEARAVYDWLESRGADILFARRSTPGECDCDDRACALTHRHTAGPDDCTSAAQIFYRLPNSAGTYAWFATTLEDRPED
jgi:hypothetical protein